MADSCPIDNKTGVEMIMDQLNAISKIDESAAGEINAIRSNIIDVCQKNGMRLRSGRVLGGKKRRNTSYSIGGMPPKRKPSSSSEEGAAAEDRMEGIEVAEKADIIAKIDSLPEPKKREVLNAIAHIIAAGTITGGAAALVCAIIPVLEVYLVAANIVPSLCTGTGAMGMAEWGFRSVIAPLSRGGVDSCMDIQARYNLIMNQFIALLGLPTIGAMLNNRAQIQVGYLKYKNLIYDGLMSVTRLFKSSSKPIEIQKQNTTELTQLIVNLNAFANDIAPDSGEGDTKIQEQLQEQLQQQKDAIKEFAANLSKEEREYFEKDVSGPSDTSDWPEDYGMEYGGKKRRTRRKRNMRRTHGKRRTHSKHRTHSKRKTHSKQTRKSKKH